MRGLGRPEHRIARPDALMALIAALATALGVMLAPHAPQSIHSLMILLPAFLCFLAALHFSAGLALYWATSNLFSAAQTVALRRVLRRRQGTR